MPSISGLTVCLYHVTYAFQSESTLYSCLNAKELLARSSLLEAVCSKLLEAVCLSVRL